MSRALIRLRLSQYLWGKCADRPCLSQCVLARAVCNSQLTLFQLQLSVLTLSQNNQTFRQYCNINSIIVAKHLVRHYSAILHQLATSFLLNNIRDFVHIAQPSTLRPPHFSFEPQLHSTSLQAHTTTSGNTDSRHHRCISGSRRACAQVTVAG